MALTRVTSTVAGKRIPKRVTLSEMKNLRGVVLGDSFIVSDKENNIYQAVDAAIVTEDENLIVAGVADTSISFQIQEPLGELTATDLDVTPNVTGVSTLVISNSVATNVTNFDGGSSRHRLTLIFTNGNTTLVHGASTIVLKGAIDVTPTTNQIINLVKHSGQAYWIEESRNF